MNVNIVKDWSNAALIDPVPLILLECTEHSF